MVSGLCKRVPVVFYMALLFLALTATRSPATPVQPDIEELLQQAEQPREPHIPSRAGWNGPEMQRRESAPLPGLTPALSAEQFRRALMAAAVPDWRAVVALMALVLILRRVRQAAPQQPVPEQKPAMEGPPQQLAA